jgi:hypothetical protein
MPQDPNTVSVKFLKNRENNMKETEIVMFMEWFSNQRFPEQE